MPTPGLQKFMAPGNTTPPSTPPGAQQNKTATQQSSTSAASRKGKANVSTQSSSFQPPRKATRLSKQASAFNFKNTREDTVDLGD